MSHFTNLSLVLHIFHVWRSFLVAPQKSVVCKISSICSERAKTSLVCTCVCVGNLSVGEWQLCVSFSACSKDYAGSRMARSVGGDSHFTSDHQNQIFWTRTHTCRHGEQNVTRKLHSFMQDLFASTFFFLSYAHIKQDTHTHRDRERGVLQSHREPASHTEQPDNMSVNQCQVSCLVSSLRPTSGQIACVKETDVSL